MHSCTAAVSEGHAAACSLLRPSSSASWARAFPQQHPSSIPHLSAMWWNMKRMLRMHPRPDRSIGGNSSFIFITVCLLCLGVGVAAKGIVAAKWGLAWGSVLWQYGGLCTLLSYLHWVQFGVQCCCDGKAVCVSCCLGLSLFIWIWRDISVLRYIQSNLFLKCHVV